MYFFIGVKVKIYFAEIVGHLSLVGIYLIISLLNNVVSKTGKDGKRCILSEEHTKDFNNGKMQILAR